MHFAFGRERPWEWDFHGFVYLAFSLAKEQFWVCCSTRRTVRNLRQNSLLEEQKLTGFKVLLLKGPGLVPDGIHI